MEATTASRTRTKTDRQRKAEEILENCQEPDQEMIRRRVKGLFKLFGSAESSQGQQTAVQRFGQLRTEMPGTYLDFIEALCQISTEDEKRHEAAKFLLLTDLRRPLIIESLAKFWDLAEAIKVLKSHLENHELTVAIGKAGYSPESIAQAVLQNRADNEESEGARTILLGALNRL